MLCLLKYSVVCRVLLWCVSCWVCLICWCRVLRWVVGGSVCGDCFGSCGRVCFRVLMLYRLYLEVLVSCWCWCLRF